MITKERLEQLIKEGATIWVKNDYQIYEINTSYFVNIDIIDNVLYCGSEMVCLDYLFETKEEAQWHLDFTAERVERLELPMWEEIQSNIDEVKNGKDKINISFIKQFNHSQLGYIDLAIVKIEEEPIQLEVSNNDYYVQSWEATKENYIEACKLCIKLFKGGE